MRKQVIIGLTLFLTLLIFTNLLFAEEKAAKEKEFPVLKGPYLGQKVPGLKAEIFAPGIISIKGRYEYGISFSPDGKELLYSIEPPSRVMYTKQTNGIWSKPGVTNFTKGTKKTEMEAFFTPDGKRVHFAAHNKGMDFRIWFVDKEDDGWSNAKELVSPLNSGPVFYPVCSKNKTLYYTDIKARKTYRALWVNGSYSKVEDAGLAFGGHGFIAPDESFILLDSRQQPDSLGKGDIYIAFKKKDGSWAKPVNMGDKVNSSYSESCPALSPDGKFIFFSRYNDVGGASDFYWISSKIIDEVKKNKD
ncbi:MAG: hypothetical protein GY757_36080 [bacterium]|nr:hypothetical protein [bacterium]